MEAFARIGIALAQMALLVVCAPLVTGVIQRLKARLQCRSGASVWQPYRDLAKLFRKGTTQSDTASSIFAGLPVMVLAATLAAAALVPIVWIYPVDGAGSGVLP